MDSVDTPLRGRAAGRKTFFAAIAATLALASAYGLSLSLRRGIQGFPSAPDAGGLV